MTFFSYVILKCTSNVLAILKMVPFHLSRSSLHFRTTFLHVLIEKHFHVIFERNYYKLCFRYYTFRKLQRGNSKRKQKMLFCVMHRKPEWWWELCIVFSTWSLVELNSFVSVSPTAPAVSNTHYCCKLWLCWKTVSDRCQ